MIPILQTISLLNLFFNLYKFLILHRRWAFRNGPMFQISPNNTIFITLMELMVMLHRYLHIKKRHGKRKTLVKPHFLIKLLCGYRLVSFYFHGCTTTRLLLFFHKMATVDIPIRSNRIVWGDYQSHFLVFIITDKNFLILAASIIYIQHVPYIYGILNQHFFSLTLSLKSGKHLYFKLVFITTLQSNIVFVGFYVSIN